MESISEPVIRGAFFVGVFLLMAVCELLDARRELSGSRARRWIGTLGLVAVDALMVRLLFFGAAYGAAITAERLGWGFFRWVGLSEWIAVVLSVILLDMLLYFQHVIFHKYASLWRLHRVHHCDVDCDVTTGIRFHPIEIGMSMLVKMAAVAILGVPVLGILVFEVLLNATAMFSHSNIWLPEGLDRVLRWIIVTPDMHRIHHSADIAERDNNYGFNLSWWDRIFGTYVEEPALGQEKMHIGVDGIDGFAWQTLPQLLRMPFASSRVIDSQGVSGSEDSDASSSPEGAQNR